jgi:predicted Zn finger-like uncharacterized protein
MPARRIPCPECDASIRLSPDHPAGKKVRCPECDALVRPPADDDAPVRRSSRRDDDYDDRPRRSGSRGKKKAQKSNAPLIIVGSVVLTLMLVGGVVGVVLLTRDSKNKEPVIADNGPKGGPVAKGPAGGPKGVVPPKSSGRVVGLEIGNEAPDIEGEDLDGVPFKLSDYRGKVVMLDFWGNW